MYRIYNQKETFTMKAQKEGYPARSVYKLKEINERHKLIKNGDRVLDLGCAPGSWLLYVSKIIGERGQVVGIDKSEVKIKLPKNTVCLQKDIMELRSSDLQIKKYDLVISDMAPSTSGVKIVDIGRSLDLCERALEVAIAFLKPNGIFICKIFESGGVQNFLSQTKRFFGSVKFFRPVAVIRGSKEIYMIAKGLKK